MNPKNLLHAALGLLAMATLTGAQPFTKADSGWVALFNGTNFDGLYSRMYNHEVTDIPNKTFSVVDGTIKVTQGSGWEEGPIGMDKQYTHYRARVEYKFDGTEVLVCERSPCNARDYGASVILDKRGEWNLMEILVRGSDSSLHRVNDRGPSPGPCPPRYQRQGL